MSCSKLVAWEAEQWNNPSMGSALVERFDGLMPEGTTQAVLSAFSASPACILEAMKAATGLTARSEDINYIWTSKGRMALVLDEGRNQPSQKPPCESLGDTVSYDETLRAWVADLGLIHAAVLEQVSDEEERKALDATQFCDDGDWANGISLTPFPKFPLVTKWLQKHCAELVAIANKMVFFKAPGTTKPPFMQIKVHRTCFLFKGREGPGSVLVNPEFAVKGANLLREDLPSSVFDELSLAVEVIGGKPEGFPNGLNGKLTHVGGELKMIPLVPAMVKKFAPQADDAETDATNAYVAFRNSHPQIE